MLNFYLFGVFLVCLTVAYEIIFKNLIEEVVYENPDAPEELIAIGIILGLIFSLALSWVTIIMRTHAFLMKKF